MIVFTESWDGYGTDVTLPDQGVWTGGVTASGSIVAGGGRCGTNAYRNTGSGVAGPHVGLIIGDQFAWGQVALRKASTIDGLDDLSFRDAGGGVQVFFRFRSDGSIEFWRGPNTVLGAFLVGTVPAVFSQNNYFVLSWEMLCAGSSGGTVRAWVDGVERIPLTAGITTRTNFGSQNPYSQMRVALTGDFRTDDAVFGDGVDSGIPGLPNNAMIPPVHVGGQVAELDSVAGGGFYKEFTPQSGTDHGAMVDGIPPNDAEYNGSAAAVQKDTYTLPDIKIGAGTVYAINIRPRVVKSDAFNARTMRPMFRLAAVDTLGVAQAVPDTQPGWRWEIFEGSAVATAWTVANVNAAEYGLEDSS